MQNTSFGRGVIAFVCILTLSDAMAEFSNDQNHNQSQNNAEYRQSNPGQPGIPPPAWQPPKSTILPSDDAAKASVYQYKCYDPPTREDADACQQRRSAQAAEDQWWISFWALIAAAFASFFTGWAAFAAAAAAKAASGATDEARRANDIAETTAKRQLRAYLSIARLAISDDRKSLTLTVRNSGQTPAHNVKAKLNWQWYSAGEKMPSDFKFPDYSIIREGSDDVFIGSGSEYPWTFDIDNIKIMQLVSGSIALYFYGHFTYYDIFADKQSITFCYEGVSFGGGRAGLRMADRHNEST